MEGLGVFTGLDMAVVIAMLALLLLIGWRSARRIRTEEDFVHGGGHLDSRLVGLSMFATLFSTLSYLAYPGEMIQYGPVFCAGILSFPIAWWIVGTYLVPRFVSMRVTSAYEILEIKVGKGTRSLASLFFLLLRFLWMGTIVYATVDTALIPIMGLNPAWTPWISLVLVLVTVIYSTYGGIRAVVLTDAIQSLIMFLGVGLSIWVIARNVGDGAAFLDPSVRAHWPAPEWAPRAHVRMTAFNIILMNGLWQIMTAGSDQMAIQRYLTVRDTREAKKTFAISLGSSALIQLLLALVGMMVLVWFGRFPERLPVGVDPVQDADKLFPLFILTGLPPGVTGLIAAALMAAAMSSLSSGLNSCATVIQEDVLKRFWPGKIFSLRSIRWISILLGLAVAGSCLLFGQIDGNLLDIVIKVVNLVVAPLFVLFFMALFNRRATDLSTILSGCLSLVTAVYIAFSGTLAGVWIMPCSLLAGVVSGYLLSVLIPKGCIPPGHSA